jgi:hypothetical protein
MKAGPDESGEETGMNAAGSNESTRDEDRMMALLALTSQDLPAAGKTSQREALHDYLDANPAAFEQFLKKHRNQPPAQKKTWLGWFDALQLRPMRYALALGIASLCAILIARPLLDEGGALVAGLDAGYAELATHADPASLERHSLASDRDAQFGFSPQPADSQVVDSFVAGLAGGEQRLAAARRALPTASSRLLEDDESRYYALGEWNVLLSAAAHVESGLPATFWQSQLEFHGRLSEALADDRDSDPMIAAHMRRTGEHLSRLSRQSDSRRTAHELSEELRLFRGHLAE